MTLPGGASNALPTGGPPPTWSRARRIKTSAALIAVAIIIAVLASLGARIIDELSSLRSAPQDNVQWSLSQLEVEHYAMLEAALAASGDPARLDEFRRRFDIFVSRINIIRQSETFALLRRDTEAAALIQTLDQQATRLFPIVDASRPELEARLPELRGALARMKPAVRAISLAGVKLFADASDNRRKSFSQLVIWTALTAIGFIIALIATLTVLLRQSRIARLRSEEIETSNLRYRNTINASLDAIIVADAEGCIIDFNPAAERVFGYSRNTAIGQRIQELIIPPEWRAAHRAGMKRYLETGDGKLIGTGRVELQAMRASGEEFPVELSLGMTSTGTGPVFIAYIRDISDRIATQRALTEARDQALAAARAKSQFLAVMSHEMRTPLNGVLAVLDLLDHTDLDKRQQAYVNTATASGEILQHHIDDVLEITRIEAKAVQIRSQWFDLVGLLDEVADVNAPAAAARKVEISVATNLAERYVFQDRNRLRQVAINLVGNAVKFTERGQISITAEDLAPEAGQRVVEIAVRDTGIGIAREDIGRIFEDFVTLDPSYQRTAPGYGLGLAITRGIVEAMGGTIGVESTPGVGSRFSVRLRIAPSATPRPAAPIPAPPPARATASRANGCRVLLVEDNETNRFVAREMLLRAGCTVQEASDGEEAVQIAESEPFDLILMDLSMPRVDGLQATRRIRAGSGRNRDTAIVGLTAHALPEEQASLREAGMQDCLTKPLRLAKLNEALDTHLPRPERPQPADAADGVESTVLPDLVDFAILAELSEVLTEESFSAKTAAFLAELPGAVSDLSEMAARGDCAGLARLAHLHAGSAAIFGASRLFDALKRLQSAAEATEADAIADLVGDLPALTEETRSAMTEALDDG